MKVKLSRIVIVLALFAGVMATYTAVLYKLQIYDPVHGTAVAARPDVSSVRRETIRAARGDILDRNGEKLVSSRPSFDVLLTRSALLAADNTNEILLTLIHAAIKTGVPYNDTFPVNSGAPFEYRYNMTDAQRTRFVKYTEFFSELDENISAEDFINWLKKHYGIPYTTNIADARLIIGVRYELELRAIIQNLPPYVFAEDIPPEFVAQIAEQAYPGVSIQISSAREYHTTSAAHLLGYLARMDSEDYEKYGPLGYPMDAFIGRSGAEAAFEQYLHGIDGERVIETSSDGTVIEDRITREPVPGSNVYLTIDLNLQETAEAAMDKVIRGINLTREEGQLIPGASVVVTQVQTGEALAIASYPTFDISTMQKNFAELAADPNSPLFNRALQGLYSPGSTFKPVTALAGLRSGAIQRYTPIEDKGIFTDYSDYQPRCWLYTSHGASHGTLDVVGALRDSCNYFFYRVGDNTGWRNIARASYDFGFGVRALTGIDMNEKEGVVATEDYKINNTTEGGWRPGDTLLVSIGQGLNQFTPIQLANYTATIANGGTLRDMSLLHSVKSFDYSGTVFDYEPVTRSVIPETEYISYIQEGMRAVARSGTAKDMFRDYPTPVSAKTGTVQTSQDYNNGTFICYAPAENPEIAIAVVVEKGGSGAGIMEIAKIILDEYFKGNSYDAIVVEGELVR